MPIGETEETGYTHAAKVASGKAGTKARQDNTTAFQRTKFAHKVAAKGQPCSARKLRRRLPLIGESKMARAKKYRASYYRARIIEKWAAGRPQDTSFEGFWSYLIDMYSDPSDVRLNTPVDGRQGFMQDKMRMKEYFVTAVKGLDSGGK